MTHLWFLLIHTKGPFDSHKLIYVYYLSVYIIVSSFRFVIMASQPEAPTAEIPAVANPNVEDAPSTKQTVDPWNVSGEVGEDGKVKAINYKKLVEEFGTKLIDQELLDRFERVTGHKPHRFMRRQIVFSQRDLELILDRHEKVPYASYSLA